MSQYRFRVTQLSFATLDVDGKALSYQRSAYRARVPLANVRGVALRRRQRGLLGLISSELVLVTEPLPGVRRVLRWTIDPDSDDGKAALKAVAAAVPAADALALPWREAAARLGLPRASARDAFLGRWGQVGAGALGAACALLVLNGTVFPSPTAAAARAQQLTFMVIAALGVLLMAWSYWKARRD